MRIAYGVVALSLCAPWVVLPVSAQSAPIREPDLPKIPPGEVALDRVGSARTFGVQKVRQLPAGAVKTEMPTASTPPRLRISRDLVQMTLALEGQGASAAPEALKVIASESKSGTALPSRITTGASGKPELELPAEGRAVVSSAAGSAGAGQQAIEPQEKTPMPWLVVDTKRQGPTSLVRTTRPFIQLATAVRWDGGKRRHVAALLFGMDAESGGEAFGDALSPPLPVRFAVSCESISAPMVEIARIGPAGYVPLSVECSPAVKNERKEQTIEVLTGHGRVPYHFAIPRRPGPPLLLASALDVLGFGLGTTTLTARSIEEDGSPLRVTEPLSVQLVATSGTIDASAITLDRGQSEASTKIRSSGIGRLEITPVAGGLRGSPIAIRLGWPVLPLGAMVLGGTMGGVLFVLPGKRKRGVERRVVEGTIVGIVICCVVLVLPSFTVLPDWATQGGLGLFLIATLAGFAGTPLVHKAVATVFPGWRENEKNSG